MLINLPGHPQLGGVRLGDGGVVVKEGGRADRVFILCRRA